MTIKQYFLLFLILCSGHGYGQFNSHERETLDNAMAALKETIEIIEKAELKANQRPQRYRINYFFAKKDLRKVEYMLEKRIQELQHITDNTMTLEGDYQ